MSITKQTTLVCERCSRQMMIDSKEIYGLNQTPEEINDKALVYIPRELLDSEPLWMRTKWFDYRFESPQHSTYRFAHAYALAYKETFKRVYDDEKGDHVKGFKGKDIFAPEQKNATLPRSMWRARQYADGLGMPYIEFCRAGLHWAVQRNRRFLPRPAHLCNFNLLTAINTTWQERQTGILFHASHANYLNEHYAGLNAQDDHHEWLFVQLSKRGNPVPALRTILGRDLLPIEKAKARLGDDVLYDALN